MFGLGLYVYFSLDFVYPIGWHDSLSLCLTLRSLPVPLPLFPETEHNQSQSARDAQFSLLFLPHTIPSSNPQPLRPSTPPLNAHPFPLFETHRTVADLHNVTCLFLVVYKGRREESLGLLTASLLQSAQEMLSHL